MLSAAREEYVEQTRLTASAVIDAERLATRGGVAVAQSVQTYQAEALNVSLGALAAILAEQGISDAQDATVAPAALLTPVQGLAEMLVKTDSPKALTRLVQTMVRDAGRTTRAVDQTTRLAVTGYIRSLNPPSCGRCAILAGRVYRHSQGFLRHPNCDCLMTPTTLAVGRHLVTDPMALFENGQITDLSQADADAVRMGADLAKVVNVRRHSAGLTVGSSVLARRGRLTPEGCLTLASDRAQALELLRQYGYIL